MYIFICLCGVGGCCEYVLCVCMCIYMSVCVCVRADGVNYGPLHSPQGVELFKQAVADAVAQGGKIEYGGKVLRVHD